jgi:hypothetical protein
LRLSCRSALMLLLYFCVLSFNGFCYFAEVMAR